jgi:hypothetical protein|tara:strand:+ start:229 stop:354 length:126 start_codon:yes stop_codon:yes gene_type:complete
MPFKSEKQRRYLWKNNPKLAREWEEKYGSKTKKKKRKKRKK